MATVSSSSTFAQVQAAYDDNASYAEDDSVTKARAFVTAARILLRRQPTESRQGAASIRHQMDLIRAEITSASEWLAKNDSARSTTEVIYPDLRDYRRP